MTTDTAHAATGWDDAWCRALDDLELDVAATEAMLRTLHDGLELPVPRGWTPPSGLGPLPAPLHERAGALLARQLEVAAAVAAELATTRRHAAVARAASSRETERPLFVDRSA